jgi:putative endonuclease
MPTSKRKPQPRSESTRARGTAAERRAAWHYRLRGYKILDANVWAGRYEVDLVARRGRTLVFCEVKDKASARFGDPFEMVDEEKQRRIRAAAETWLARQPRLAELDVRFEVVAFRGGRLERLADAF